MQWLTVVQKLQRIAQAGLTYQKSPYDQQRYAEILEIAAEITAGALGQDISELTGFFRAERGYATPKLDVRAVVPHAGKLLFVKEAQDGLWSLPGGWADIGESPSEIAAREVREEAGFEVRVTKLLAVYDKAKHAHPPELWYCYKLFFLCELTGGAATPSIETTEVAFFGANEIPPLSVRRITESQVVRMFTHLAHPTLPTDFD